MQGSKPMFFSRCVSNHTKTELGHVLFAEQCTLLNICLQTTLNTGLKIMPKMVPAKMSVTKELVPDILHLVPVTNLVNFFQVKLVYSILRIEY